MACGTPTPMGCQFEQGQVWIYKTREGDDDSRAIVQQVDESTPLGPVVHFCLTNLKGLAVDGSGQPGDIGFLPQKLEVALQSVTTLESTTTNLPHSADFAEGYSEWLQAMHGGEAGAWDLPLKEVVVTVASGKPS